MILDAVKIVVSALQAHLNLSYIFLKSFFSILGTFFAGPEMCRGCVQPTQKVRKATRGSILLYQEA